MPSFLSKVFLRPSTKEKEKDKDSKSHRERKESDLSLLDGKFEAVAPSSSNTSSPVVDVFPPNSVSNDKEKENTSNFGLFRPKSRPSTSSPGLSNSASRPSQNGHGTSSASKADYHLSLNLSNLKSPLTGEGSRSLGVLFESGVEDEDAGGAGALGDKKIAGRNLTPAEATRLVEACGKYIFERGAFHILPISK